MTQQQINEFQEKAMLKYANQKGRKEQAWMLEKTTDADYNPFDNGEPNLKAN